MCNLDSQKKSQAEIRDLAKAMVDHAGNMPALHAVFPNGNAWWRKPTGSLYSGPLPSHSNSVGWAGAACEKVCQAWSKFHGAIPRI
jgi:hypothetical protein